MQNPLQLVDELAQLDDPEFHLDPYHPDNDQYFKAQLDLQRKLRAVRALIKPKYVRLVEMHMAGQSHVQIAEQTGLGAQAISRHVNTPDAKRLIALSHCLTALKDGPRKDHRMAILYRIVIDNEQDYPEVSINAIKELNKMQGDSAEGAQGGGITNNQYNLTINGQLPQGALDTLPKMYDEQQQPEALEHLEEL